MVCIRGESLTIHISQMKLFNAIATAAVIGTASLMTGTAHAQSLPLRVGMNYGEARDKLIQQGWQPHMPTGAEILSCGDRGPCTYKGLGDSEDARSFINREIELRQAFRDRGWHETVHCYPSGAGWCFHSFTNASGKELVVQTGSGAYKKVPNVIKFYFAQ